MFMAFRAAGRGLSHQPASNGGWRELNVASGNNGNGGSLKRVGGNGVWQLALIGVT